jgi:predicted nucleotide-binding protein (sugar kinase/HSP70/actin superfamily)
MKDLRNGICSVCGGDEGIHQYETMFCPVGGVEENRYDKLNNKYYPQKWQNTTFIDSGEESLRVDAINTANKCGLLPSELLKEVEELRQWKKEQVETVEPLLQKMKNSKKALTEQRDELLEFAENYVCDLNGLFYQNRLNENGIKHRERLMELLNSIKKGG